MTAITEAPEQVAFAVRLSEFEGPLDLLLSLISKRRLELTALALHQVTDDFIAHIRAQGDGWDLDEATEFLLIAATLVDLKAARLLPGDEPEDEEDLALLEARDLLFARLLQYRAYKQLASSFEESLHSPQRCFPRAVGLDPDLLGLLPEVVLPITPDQFAALAVRALTPQLPPEVAVEHIHATAVSVAEQAELVLRRLSTNPELPFRVLVADAPDILHVVVRFLALLELFRDSQVHFEQAAPMAELLIRAAAEESITL